MRGIRTEQSNHDFGPPPGQEDEIFNLPVEWEREGQVGTTVWSVWEPSDEERQAIANGENVKVGIGWIGGFPPMMVTTTDEKKIGDWNKVGE